MSADNAYLEIAFLPRPAAASQSPGKPWARNRSRHSRTVLRFNDGRRQWRTRFCRPRSPEGSGSVVPPVVACPRPAAIVRVDCADLGTGRVGRWCGACTDDTPSVTKMAIYLLDTTLKRARHQLQFFPERACCGLRPPLDQSIGRRPEAVYTHPQRRWWRDRDVRRRLPAPWPRRFRPRT
jgi:hypothetical protein